MKKHLVIIGARGFGREVFGFAHQVAAFQRGEFDIKGFLDDKADLLDGYPCPYGDYPPILGPVETYEPQPDDVFFCALGDAKWRRVYSGKILAKGGEFISLISPEAHVSNAATIGRGVMICSWTSVSTNVRIGDFTIVHPLCNFGHDVRVGSYCTIESHVFMGGFSEMGDGSTLHVRAGIIPKKRIGRNVSVGFGSVVMRNFGDDVHVFGNPAKVMDF